MYMQLGMCHWPKHLQKNKWFFVRWRDHSTESVQSDLSRQFMVCMMKVNDCNETVVLKVLLYGCLELIPD